MNANMLFAAGFVSVRMACPYTVFKLYDKYTCCRMISTFDSLMNHNMLNILYSSFRILLWNRDFSFHYVELTRIKPVIFFIGITT